MNKLRFDKLSLSAPIMKAVVDMGFEEASPIQSETIPHLLQGRDIIGQAQTGTGKTAAFAIPVIENLKRDTRGLQALVLCPTRELVIQVTEEFRKLMKYRPDASVVAVYGGQEIDRQLRALRKNPGIVVGTPGRIMDHMRRGSIAMDTVTTVVLDEADEMLDMGFRDDIEIILKDTPADRQTVMFSATMSRDILNLTKHYQKDPVRIDVSAHKINAPLIEQEYFEIPDKAKAEALARLIDFHDIKLALVFCNTKSRVDGLVEVLKTRGYFAEGLHGDMNQKQREKVMSGFRKGVVEILVATDVAGRGIDVNDIAAVFNYDLPRDDEDYIHRIGRTGRAGKSGRAFTFIVGKEIYNLRRIERTNGVKIVRRQVPTIDNLDETLVQAYGSRITKMIEKGVLSKYVRMVESIMADEYTSLDIAAALLKIVMDSKTEGYDETQRFDADKRQAPGRVPLYKSRDKRPYKKQNRAAHGGPKKSNGAKGKKKNKGAADRGTR